MSDKRCKSCGKTKARMHFYRHPSTADGFMPDCKPCHRRHVKENRELKHEHYRAADRARGMLPHRVAQRKAYQLTAAGKAAQLKANRVYRRNLRTFGSSKCSS